MAANDKNIIGIILDIPENSDLALPTALREINNTSFLQSIAGPMKESGCDPILFITPDPNPIITESNRIGVIPVTDDSRKKGEIPGLKKALLNLRRDMLGAIVTPITYPQITKNVYLLLCHVFMENPDRIIIPIFKGRRGFPVALPNSVLDDIRGNTSILYFDDLLRAHSGLIFEQLVNDPGISKLFRPDD